MRRTVGPVRVCTERSGIVHCASGPCTCGEVCDWLLIGGSDGVRPVYVRRGLLNEIH
jgi:hypothetical protein